MLKDHYLNMISYLLIHYHIQIVLQKVLDSHQREVIQFLTQDLQNVHHHHTLLKRMVLYLPEFQKVHILKFPINLVVLFQMEDIIHQVLVQLIILQLDPIMIILTLFHLEGFVVLIQMVISYVIDQMNCLEIILLLKMIL